MSQSVPGRAERPERRRFEGRVIHVSPVTGGYGVTLGPGPDVAWYICPLPPNLGAYIALSAIVCATQSVELGDKTGTVTVLSSVKLEESPATPAARVVAPEWYARVRGSMRRPLYKYQEEGSAWLAERITSRNGSIVADEMGLGKSAQAIAAVCATRSFPCLVVCPASVRDNWVREFGFALRVPSIEVVQGRQGMILGAEVIICTYDLLAWRERQLASLRPRVILFDEAQGLKEPKPAPRHRAAVATRLAHYIGCAVLLTGTPVLNRPKELFRLLHITAPKRWPSYQRFWDRYCKPPDEGTIDLQRRIKNSAGNAERLDELQTLVQPSMLRRLKRDVAIDLPPKSRRSVVITLDAADMAAYRAAENDVVAWLRSQGSDAKARAAAVAPSLVKLTHLRRLAATGKLTRALPDYLTAWFDRKDAEPLVVFAHHRDVLNGIFAIAYKLGIRTSGIVGSDDVTKRQRAVDDFQEGVSQMFVASIQAGGTGITLHRASEMLIVERDWVPSRMLQAEDRLHRAGQLRPVTITYLDAADTIDQHVADVAQAKSQLIDHMLDGQQINDTMATMATIESVLERYRGDAAATVDPVQVRA